jgi:hypothetical protein
MLGFGFEEFLMTCRSNMGFFFEARWPGPNDSLGYIYFSNDVFINEAIALLEYQ